MLKVQFCNKTVLLIWSYRCNFTSQILYLYLKLTNSSLISESCSNITALWCIPNLDNCFAFLLTFQQYFLFLLCLFSMIMMVAGQSWGMGGESCPLVGWVSTNLQAQIAFRPARLVNVNESCLIAHYKTWSNNVNIYFCSCSVYSVRRMPIPFYRRCFYGKEDGENCVCGRKNYGHLYTCSRAGGGGGCFN